MTKQQINTTYLASEIFRVERALASCPDYCLSRKRNKKNGRDYWYRQYPASQGRKQVYIKKKDVAAERAAVARKKELKKRLRDLKAQYKALSFAQRKDVRYLTSCYREAEAAGVGEIEKNTHLDGTSRDSKSEIMISMILEKFGVKYKYGHSIMAAGYRHIVDFFFPESGDYYEHMGKLDDEKYKNDQKEKLAHYEAENIKPNENLLITSEHYVPEKKICLFRRPKDCTFSERLREDFAPQSLQVSLPPQKSKTLKKKAPAGRFLVMSKIVCCLEIGQLNSYAAERNSSRNLLTAYEFFQCSLSCTLQ